MTLGILAEESVATTAIKQGSAGLHTIFAMSPHALLWGRLAAVDKIGASCL